VLVACSVKDRFTQPVIVVRPHKNHTLVHNFNKCWPIFKILSLLYSPRNLQQNSRQHVPPLLPCESYNLKFNHFRLQLLQTPPKINIVHRVSKKTHIIGYKLRNSCPILIIFDIKIPHII